MLRDLKRANGIALSPDEQNLYVVDNAQGKIWAFDVSEPGRPVSGKVLTEGLTGDGMTVDRDGRLYLVGEGAVWVYDAGGQWVAIITVPESPSNCTFGGEGHPILFITARTGFYRVPLLTAGGRRGRTFRRRPAVSSIAPDRSARLRGGGAPEPGRGGRCIPRAG